MSEEDIKTAIELIKFFVSWYISEGTWNKEMEQDALKDQEFLINMIKKQREKNNGL